MIEIVHNFDPKSFMWLWAKYVIGWNDKYHCTNCIRGRYSKKFSRNNPNFESSRSVIFDEQPDSAFRAIYICGVSKQGYSAKRNYSHNVHAAILPVAGASDCWSFESWRMTVSNGRLLSIPKNAANIPERYRTLPDEFTTCRIFRWAASFFAGQVSD